MRLVEGSGSWCLRIFGIFVRELQWHGILPTGNHSVTHMRANTVFSSDSKEKTTLSSKPAFEISVQSSAKADISNPLENYGATPGVLWRGVLPWLEYITGSGTTRKPFTIGNSLRLDTLETQLGPVQCRPSLVWWSDPVGPIEFLPVRNVLAVDLSTSPRFSVRKRTVIRRKCVPYTDQTCLFE